MATCSHKIDKRATHFMIAGAAENCNLSHAYLQNGSDFNNMNSESFRESKVL